MNELSDLFALINRAETVTLPLIIQEIMRIQRERGLEPDDGAMKPTTGKNQRITLEDAFDFITNTDRKNWSRLTKKMIQVQRERDLESMSRLSIGDLVVFEGLRKADGLKGRITKFGCGLVSLAVTS